MPDRIEETLRTLSRDLDQLGLADSGAIRRRGDQRTRNQAIGSGLAVVAVVAGVIGAAGGLTGDRDAVQGPPANPSVTTTQEPALRLADQPLFTPEDLGAVGPYTDWQVSPDPVPADPRPSLCVPDPGTLGAAEMQSRLLFGELEATAQEHVLRFADTATAAAAVRTLSTAFATCDPGDPAEAKVVDRAPVALERPVGDEAVRASRTATPLVASEVSYYELGVARQANVVVVLQWRAGPLPEVDWVWDAGRMSAALTRAVG